MGLGFRVYGLGVYSLGVLSLGFRGLRSCRVCGHCFSRFLGLSRAIVTIVFV